MKNNEINHLVSLIIKQSNVYKWQHSFSRCLQLQLHAYRLVIQTEHKNLHNPILDKKYLLALMRIISETLNKKCTVPSELLILVWTWIFNKADKTLIMVLFKLILITVYVSIFSS